MQRPAAGVVGVEGDKDAAHRGHQDSVADRAADRGAVDAEDLEGMAMQMDGMRHHRLIDHIDGDALALPDGQDPAIRPIPPFNDQI